MTFIISAFNYIATITFIHFRTGCYDYKYDILYNYFMLTFNISSEFDAVLAACRIAFTARNIGEYIIIQSHINRLFFFNCYMFSSISSQI